MLTRDADPPRWRILAAFLIAPAVAALLLAVFEPAYDGLPMPERIWRSALIYGLVGAYPAALIGGIPTYFILRDRISASALNCALAGAFVASLPWLLLVLVAPNADQASINGKATVIDGSKTAYGWLIDLQFIGEIALFGLLAGLVFWAIAVARWKGHRDIQPL